MKRPRLTSYGDYAMWVTFEVMANYRVRLILTDDIFKSAKDRLGSLPEDAADAFCFHVKSTGLSYLVLKHDSPAGTIAHECWHIIYRMFHWCGVRDFDDETTAYHLDHMVEKVYEFKRSIEAAKAEESKNVSKN